MTEFQLTVALLVKAIIRNFDISKVHGFDDISIRMVNLCDDFFVKPFITSQIVGKNQTSEFTRKMTNY